VLPCSLRGVRMIRPGKRYAQSRRSEDIMQVFRRLGLSTQPGEIKLLLAVLKRAVDDLDHPKVKVCVDAESFLFNPEDLGLENICELLDLRVEYARNLIRLQVARSKKEAA